MTHEEALAALGVHEDLLTEEHRSRLDEDGFLVLPGVLTRDQASRIAARLDELAAAEGDLAGIETHQESGTTRLSDLINKDPMFDVVLGEPRVLAGVAHVLPRDFRLSSLNSRAALPGRGHQHLHADWEEPVPPGDYRVCNTIWLLDDFTEENGPTRLVPGSHRSGKLPRDEMADPGATHPREVRLIAPAGTVVVFNSHCWHGGTLNRTDRPRRAMHAYFCRRDQPQQTDQRHYLRPETAARLSPAARYLLDV